MNLMRYAGKCLLASAIGPLGLLVACNGTNLAGGLANATALVTAACADAQKAGTQAGLMALGGAALTVSGINTYVNAGCATAETIAALVKDSSSLQWLGQQQGALQTLATSQGHGVAPVSVSRPVFLPAPVPAP